MKVCAYLMTADTGLAPNPFHGICTLAVCTPNHRRARLKPDDDWIVGLASAPLRARFIDSNKWRIVYAMCVSEVLELDQYFRDPRFVKKIPKRQGTRIERCGDNFYRIENGALRYQKDIANDHEWDAVQAQDRYGNKVFVGREYYYFGSKAKELPDSVSWADKLKQKFAASGIGIKYIFGGSSGVQWDDKERESFLAFLRKEALPNLPEPKDFSSHWGPETVSCR